MILSRLFTKFRDFRHVISHFSETFLIIALVFCKELHTKPAFYPKKRPYIEISLEIYGDLV